MKILCPSTVFLCQKYTVRGGAEVDLKPTHLVVGIIDINSSFFRRATFTVDATASQQSDTCKNPHQHVDIVLPPTEKWVSGTVYMFTIKRIGGQRKTRLVVMDENNEITVKPPVATFNQIVNVTCFKGRLSKLKKALRSYFTDTQIEYMEMHANLGQSAYVLIASYRPSRGFAIEPEVRGLTPSLVVLYTGLNYYIVWIRSQVWF